MIDESDGDEMIFLSLITNGPFGIFLAVLAIVFWIIAAHNETDCSKKICPDQQSAKLMQHECMCVTLAK